MRIRLAPSACVCYDNKHLRPNENESREGIIVELWRRHCFAKGVKIKAKLNITINYLAGIFNIE